MDERCYALGTAGVCRVLSVHKCEGEACGFYKPRWRFESGLRLADARLCRLPAEQQVQIAEKYYAGQMPWKEK